MSKLDQNKIYNLFEYRPILINGSLAVYLGSIEAAIIIGQLLYWQGHGAKKGWVYKTVKEMHAETGIPRHKQSSAIKRCIDLGILKVKLGGIPATRHFQVDVDLLYQQITSWPKFGDLAKRKTAGSIAGKRRSITETTLRKPKKTSESWGAIKIAKQGLANSKSVSDGPRGRISNGFGSQR